MVQHSKDISQKTLSFLKTKGYGLEISPYFDPFIPKSKYRVFYTDYISSEEIKAKASENPDYAGADVPEIDFVWQPGSALKDCVPSNVKFDYAVASHVMEHVPNPVGWLNEILSVMKVGANVALFLPDRRRTADYFRQETQFYQLAQWWIEQPAVPTPGQIMDFMSHSLLVNHETEVDWTSADRRGEVLRAYPDEEAVAHGIFSYRLRRYIDIHCTVWTAESFSDAFQRAINAGLINAEIAFVAEDGAEFVAVLTKLGEPKQSPPALRKPEPEPKQIDDLLANIAHQVEVLRYDVAARHDLIHVDIRDRLDLLQCDVGGRLDLLQSDVDGRLDSIHSDAKHWLSTLLHDVSFLSKELGHVAGTAEDRAQQSRLSARFKTWIKVLTGRTRL